MAKEEMYHQCGFKKETATGTAHTTAYIPERGAIVGAEVELKSLDGEFWTVVSVGPPVPKSTVIENEKNYRNHRKATDI